MIFAEKLMNQRKKLGYSQEQLAERLGVTRQSVSKWESGQAMPELSKLVTLSELFGISLDYFAKDYVEESIPTAMPVESEVNRRLEELTRAMRGYRYTSKTRVFGIPLVSVRFSRHSLRDGTALGIIAIGNVAIGVLSIGALSLGVFGIGAMTIGLLLGLGAVAIGLLAIGAVAIGAISFGAVALGLKIAAGAVAVGRVAVGVEASGLYTLEIQEAWTSFADVARFLECHGLWRPLQKLLELFVS